jgi:putative flippase GtrA
MTTSNTLEETISEELTTTGEGSNTGIRTPLDAPIRYIAHQIGGAKAREMERFLRFAVVGISGAVIDLGLVYVLQATILPPANNINVMIATAIAFCTAVVSNFIWTRSWVYPDSRSRSMRRQLALFAFISAVGGIGRTLWITVMHSLIGTLTLPLALPFIRIIRPYYEPGPLAPEKLGTLVAQLIAMLVVMLWNFFANRHWTYNDVE